MSRVSGEKARANIARRRRTAQRVKDRAGRAAAAERAAAPAPKPKAKRAAKKAPPAE